MKKAAAEAIGPINGISFLSFGLRCTIAIIQGITKNKSIVKANFQSPIHK